MTTRKLNTHTTHIIILSDSTGLEDDEETFFLMTVQFILRFMDTNTQSSVTRVAAGPTTGTRQRWKTPLTLSHTAWVQSQLQQLLVRWPQVS